MIMAVVIFNSLIKRIRERIAQRIDISPKLSEAASDLETNPDDVPSLGGGFSRDVEDRLADLGYKM